MEWNGIVSWWLNRLFLFLFLFLLFFLLSVFITDLLSEGSFSTLFLQFDELVLLVLIERFRSHFHGKALASILKLGRTASCLIYCVRAWLLVLLVCRVERKGKDGDKDMRRRGESEGKKMEVRRGEEEIGSEEMERGIWNWEMDNKGIGSGR